MSTKKTGFGAVEYHEIHGIPFKKFYSLLQHETEWFESRSDSRIKSIRDILDLARDIATNEGINEDEALEIVQDLENPDNKSILMKYAERLDNIKAHSYTETHFKRDVALMVINSRVPKKFLKENSETFSDVYGVEFDENYQFTIDLIKLFPASMINEICEFCTNEKLEWVTPLEATGLQEPETLGESSTDSTDS